MDAFYPSPWQFLRQTFCFFSLARRSLHSISRHTAKWLNGLNCVTEETIKTKSFLAFINILINCFAAFFLPSAETQVQMLFFAQPRASPWGFVGALMAYTNLVVRIMAELEKGNYWRYLLFLKAQSRCELAFRPPPCLASRQSSSVL